MALFLVYERFRGLKFKYIDLVYLAAGEIGVAVEEHAGDGTAAPRSL